MTEKFENRKQNETQGKLTTIPTSCPTCINSTSILASLAKPEVVLVWLKVGVFIATCVLIWLNFTGKLPLETLLAVLQLFRKLL